LAGGQFKAIRTFDDIAAELRTAGVLIEANGRAFRVHECHFSAYLAVDPNGTEGSQLNSDSHGPKGEPDDCD
jgi:hypothetical protein